ncbi:hypothetical protein SAMN05920897_11933 [Alkalispirochaeta americana]|uniref:Cof subfamily of IIB subfamily of haloacid dehalogenase superfamily/HAD-superfamily hydrolase, subfamily IIB n=1 Tax=Alkalispirochaeta americana TaxID=159291 RepID=A0A1N6WY39_9SPIO|nr:Cof-type HAD-IIB family hydrolase [Alkalispirochaeta americana]SIQ94935.1 hypothetical protein SAMN05920897_11933 [Alkalispirochaeta americana]
MFKLFASDIDYTLLPHQGDIAADDIAALRRLHEEGIMVVLASGRATGSTKKILEHIFPETPPEYFISYNGARVTSLRRGTPLVARNIAPDLVTEIRRWCLQEGVTLQGYEDSTILVEEDNPYVGRYATAAGMGYRIVADIAQAIHPHGGTPKLVCHDRQERLPGHIQSLRDLGRGRWTVVTSMPHFIEIVADNTNKATALQALVAHRGFTMNEVIAIGDNLNDLEMIQEAGTGVAVANAVEELKAVADWVTRRSVSEGAVAETARKAFPDLF